MRCMAEMLDHGKITHAEIHSKIATPSERKPCRKTSFLPIARLFLRD
jgi:hypothetical protein